MSKFDAGRRSSVLIEDVLLDTQIPVKGNPPENALGQRRGKYPAPGIECGPATTVVIESRALIRECLVKCLSDGKKHDSICAFSYVEEWLKERIERPSAAVVVLCVGERTETEVERDIRLLSEADPDISIVILSDGEDAGSVLWSLDKGVRGYIPTSLALDVVIGAISLVRAGGTFVPAGSLIASRDSIGKSPSASESPVGGLFTPRQGKVVEALRQGKSNKIIAHELNMCESTVKVHVRNIMKKLNAKNRTEVAFLMNGADAKSPAIAPAKFHYHGDEKRAY